MFKFFDKVKKSRAGYTLTELIVVVAILGILAAIGIPVIMSARQDAEDKADQASMSSIEQAIQLGLAEGDLKLDASKKLDTSSTGFTGLIQKRLVGKQFPNCNATNGPVWWLDLATFKVYTAQAPAAEPARFKLTN